MSKGFKFFSRLIVGLLLIIISGVLLVWLFNTVVIPRLPVQRGADFVQDVSGSMKDPDKTYARIDGGVSNPGYFSVIGFVWR